jgi:hypothetical protein
VRTQDILTPAIAANPDLKRTSLNVMTVVYSNGIDVTILVSKKVPPIYTHVIVSDALIADLCFIKIIPSTLTLSLLLRRAAIACRVAVSRL